VLQYLTDPALLGFSGFNLGSTLGSTQGWHSSGSTLKVATAAGTGNAGAAVVAITGTSTTAWVANAQTANPGGIGASMNDATVYTCKLYTGWSGNGSASFGPVVGGGSTVPVSTTQQGPTVWATVAGPGSSWGFGTSFGAGAMYTAINAPPAANTWYQLAMIVNPAANQVSIYVQDLTHGSGWVLLQFSGGVTTLPAGLAPGVESPSLYSGFEISGPAGTQFDALGAELYAFPGSPVSTYTPATYFFTPNSNPPIGPQVPPTDGPLPDWAFWTLGAGMVALMLGAQARRIRST
jgi:hypothetical protein